MKYYSVIVTTTEYYLLPAENEGAAVADVTSGACLMLKKEEVIDVKQEVGMGG